MSVALSNYAASGLGENTAYLELCGHGEITHWKETKGNDYFSDSGVHYYPDFRKEDIPILLNLEYERIIMDFGDAYVSFREEILRCDRKVFLLNLNPWQKFAAEKMADTIQNKNWGGIQPLYASVNAQKDVKEEMEKKYKIQVTDIFSIPNPKRIRTESFSCMDFILGYSNANTKRRKSLLSIRRKA